MKISILDPLTGSNPQLFHTRITLPILPALIHSYLVEVGFYSISWSLSEKKQGNVSYSLHLNNNGEGSETAC